MRANADAGESGLRRTSYLDDSAETEMNILIELVRGIRNVRENTMSIQRAKSRR